MMAKDLAGIGFVRTAMTVIRHADLRSPYFLISTKLLVYAVTVFLIYQISKGRNWARRILLVIVAIAFPLSILPIFESIAYNTLHTLLGFLQLALYIFAMVFLFHGSSAGWFGALRKNR